jgi:hypothetical protein
MYLLGDITFSYKQSGEMNISHIHVYYDEVKSKKMYSSVLNGQTLPLVEKNQMHLKPNVVITAYPLHDSKCTTFMITSDITKAIKEGVDRKNVFNSIVDMRNHIDEWFGQSTIIRMKLEFEHNVHNAVNVRFDRHQAEMNNKIDQYFTQMVALQQQVECQENAVNGRFDRLQGKMNDRLDMLQARMVALQRQVECQENEIALLTDELHELKKPKKVDVSCCDLLSLEEDTTKPINLNSVIEY